MEHRRSRATNARKSYPIETFTNWKKQENKVIAKLKLISPNLKQDLVEKLLQEIRIMDAPTAAEILSVSTIWQLKLTTKDWYQCLKTAGDY
jgi:hypothetical protein